MKVFLLCAGMLAASGCVSSHLRPAASVPVAAEYGRGDSRRNAPAESLAGVATSTPKDAVESAWWKQFGDERLDHLVRKVIEVNGDLASAGLRLERARLTAGLASNALIPQLNASIGSSASKPLTGDGGTSKGSSASLGVGYEIDLWRRLRGARDSATWEAQATAEDLESTALTLVGDTCTLYWTLAYLNQRIVAGDESLARVEKTQKLVQAQFNAGAVSRLELREAEQNLQSQRVTQSQLVQQRVETRNALTVLLDGQPWPIDDEPQDLRNASLPEIEEGLPAQLLSRRPDLRAAELRLRESLANVGITRVIYYPSVSLNGSVSAGGVTLRDVLSNPVATLGAGLALPFLNWNEMRLNIAISRGDYAIAANGFRNTLYQAFTEVDNALSERTELGHQLEASQKSYDEAVEIERLYGVRYRAGATALRNWLDAQETRRSAELTLSQAKLSQLENYSTLFRALGGSG